MLLLRNMPITAVAVVNHSQDLYLAGYNGYPIQATAISRIHSMLLVVTTDYLGRSSYVPLGMSHISPVSLAAATYALPEAVILNSVGFIRQKS